MFRRAASMGVYYGGGGLAACTESLGSETGDVGGDDEIDSQLGLQVDDGAAEDAEEAARVEVERLAVASPETARPAPRRLPPPMPEGGVIRAERRGGRLILTELRDEQRRREVFRASRDGGRLRLQFAGAAAASAPDQDEAAASRSAVDSGEPAGADGGVVGGCGTAPGSPAAMWPPAPAGGASSLVR